ncbi:MAG: DUF1759 domain-containing protein [Sulfitobacter sp.]|nr:DUF1759 domain-containing protein [Sulfitobacter sp.]
MTARYKAQRMVDSSSSQPPEEGHRGGSGGCLIKPPRLPVPKFDGNLLEYSQWTTMFRVVLESGPFTEEQKLILLTEALVDDAKDAVAGLVSGGASFRECMDLLRGRYGDEERRIRAVADAMKKWARMTSFRPADARKHRARCTRYLAMLEKFSAEDVRDAFVLMMFEDPIPDTRSSEWRMFIPADSSATKEGFLEYLDKFALAHDDPGSQITRFEVGTSKAVPAPLAGRRPLSAFPPRRNTALVATATDETDGGFFPGEEGQDGELGEPGPAVLAMAGLDGPSRTPASAPAAPPDSERASLVRCPICSHPHPLHHCQDYARMGNRERWNLVFKKGLCALCLFPGHRHVDCSRPNCQRCQAGHHTSLHFWPQPREPPRVAGAPPASAASAGESGAAPGGDSLGTSTGLDAAPTLWPWPRSCPASPKSR